MTPSQARQQEPNILSRKKPDVTDYSLKHRTTSDLLHHDSKSFETLPQPAPRNGTSKLALAIAMKARGEAATWFKHDPEAPAEPRRAPRCPTAEARVAYEKVHGGNELWYKHDDNMSYYPTVPNRVGAVGGDEIKKKFVSKEASEKTKEWYKHDHGSNDRYSKDVIRRNTGPVAEPVLNSEMRVQGKGGVPQWFEHHWTPSSENSRPPPRVTVPEAKEIWTKDRCGSQAGWYQHDHTVTAVEPRQPCVRSREGEEIAERLGRESLEWFSHNRRHDPSENNQIQKKVSAPVQNMLDKERKGKMRQVLGMDEVGDLTPLAAGRGVRPEAQEIARQNTTGSIAQVFDHASNGSYVSESQGAPRVIRPEAVVNFEKNKGAVSDCFLGYLDPPWKKGGHRLPPNGDIAIKHSGSSMEGIIKGTCSPESGRFHLARGIRPEAVSIAKKHTGSSMVDVMQAGHEEFVQRPPKVRSELALEIALRNRGSVQNIIS